MLKFYEFTPGWLLRMFEKTRRPSMDRFLESRKEEIKEESGGLSESEEANFKLSEPGKRKTPSFEYRSDLQKLFQFLASKRIEKWDDLPPKSQQKRVAYEHAMIELSSLRAEIIDLKSQITNSERLMAAWIVGALILYAKDLVPSVWVLCLPILFSMFGFIRFREFQRNVFDLDCYLRELELAIRPDAGWVSYFFRTRRMEQFFETRQYFWYAAFFGSCTALALAVLGVFTPQAFEVNAIHSLFSR